MKFVLVRPHMAYFTILASLTSSCGVIKTIQGQKDDVVEDRDTSFDDVMLAQVEDPNCIGGGSSVPISSAQVWEWNGNSSQPRQVEFKMQPDRIAGLRSDGISGVVFGARTDTPIDVDQDDNQTPGEGKTTNNGQVLRLCRSDGAFGRESVESIAINSQFFIAQAFDRYNDLGINKKTLLKPALYVQMLRVLHYRKGSRTLDRVVVDNAAFGKDPDSNVSFFFVNPTSKASFSKSPLHLWEVPFVLKHEYGHNVFQAHVGSALKAIKVSLSKDHGLDGFFKTRQSKAEGLSLIQDSKSKMAANGVNELFADLFAFYNGDGNMNQIKGVVGLETTRDPMIGTTAGGKRKEWTSSATDIFEGRAKAPAEELRGEPTYADEHDVAAILSYPFVQLIDAIIKDQKPNKKLEVLISSVDALAIGLGKGGAEPRLDDMTAAMIESIVASKTVTSAELTTACKAFSDRVMGLPKTVSVCN